MTNEYTDDELEGFDQERCSAIALIREFAAEGDARARQWLIDRLLVLRPASGEIDWASR